MAEFVKITKKLEEKNGIVSLSALVDDGNEYTWNLEKDSVAANNLKALYNDFIAKHPEQVTATLAPEIQKIVDEADKNAKEKRAQAESKTVETVTAEPKVEEAKSEDVLKSGDVKVEKVEKKHNYIKGLVLGVGATVLAGTLFAGGLYIGKHQNDSNETEVTQENTLGKGHAQKPAEDNLVQVSDITVDDVKNHTNDVIKYLNGPVEEGGRGLNINEEAIQGLVFEYNQEYLDTEELNELIQSGFVPNDPNDMSSTVKPARAEIKRQNALSIVNADIDPIDMGIFVVPGVTGDKTRELTAAFTQDMYDLKAAVAVINDANTTQEEKEQAQEIILKIWTSFKAYGELTDYSVKTDLPYDYNNSTVPGQFAALQYVQAYTEAARFAGVSQSERDYVSGDDIKNGATVFVDFSPMVNLTLRNYELACNGEYKPATR